MKYDHPVLSALLGVVLILGVDAWTIYLNVPLWLAILALVAALMIWLRYQYKYWPRKPR